VSGHVTTCTFVNGTLPPGITILKTNDANHNGLFSQVEAVSLSATYPYTVPYMLTIQNNGGAGTISSIVDDKVNVSAATSTYSPTCKSLIGTVIGPGQTKTCYYDAVFANSNGGTVTNLATVTVGGSSVSNNSTVHFDS